MPNESFIKTGTSYNEYNTNKRSNLEFNNSNIILYGRVTSINLINRSINFQIINNYNNNTLNYTATPLNSNNLILPLVNEIVEIKRVISSQDIYSQNSVSYFYSNPVSIYNNYNNNELPINQTDNNSNINKGFINQF